MRTVAPGIAVVPVRTPTLPPATHTNTYVVGEGRLWVFDPASPWEDEQRALAAALDARLARGETVEALVLTHHHADHVSGAVALRDHLAMTGTRPPIVAHPVTAERVAGAIRVDEAWVDGEVRDCGGRSLRAVHTPGHAPGHLVFRDAETAAMIAGDMVAGIGTILLPPDDGGDLALYLGSLQAMIDLEPSVLLPAHGEPLHQAAAVLGFYIAHRHQRTDQVRRAMERLGRSTSLDLARVVYADLEPRLHPLGAVQLVCHLRWLAAQGLARTGDGEVTWAP